MTIPRIILMLALTGLAGFTLVAISGPEKPGELPLSAPGELKNARLLYHRSDGIYLRTPGDRHAKKLLGNARYPRWAPDGSGFAFIRDDQVMLYSFASKSERALARAKKLQSVAFHPAGKEVWFIDGDSIRSVHISNGEVKTTRDGIDVREFDIAPDGRYVAATIKRLVGFRVELLGLPAGKDTAIARGCSASISPDGKYVTVNTGDHTTLSLRHLGNGKEWKTLLAPAGMKLDDQQWSNHPDWIVGVGEDAKGYVIAHRVSDGKAWRITPESDGGRPDLYVE